MPGSDEGNSRELVDRLKASDQAAWAEFVERYTNRLLQIVRRSLPGRIRQKMGEEDIVQEVFRDLFVDAYRRQFPCDSDDGLWPILTFRASRQVLDGIRKHLAARRDARRESPWSSLQVNDDQGDAEPADSDADQERPVIVHDEFRGFVSSLELREQVIVYVRLEVDTLKEVAEHLECSLRTVEGLWEGICKKAREGTMDGWINHSSDHAT